MPADGKRAEGGSDAADTKRSKSQGYKALILVGGFGTRLRPLTLNLPKPLIPFANVPMVVLQIRALKKAGVDEVILAVNYQAEKLQEQIQAHVDEIGVKVRISKEDVPLGTGGPIKLAEPYLNNGLPFFVVNSDVTCDFIFETLMEQHIANGGSGTLLMTQVTEPSKYGVILTNAKGQIEQFVEKPKEFIGNRINAGMYVLSPRVFDSALYKDGPTSIENDIFPVLAQEQTLYALDLPGFWMDVGQPPDYLSGMGLYLNSLKEKGDETLAKSVEGSTIVEPCLIDPSAKVGKGCVIGPNVVLGPNVTINDGCRIQGSAVFANAKVKKHAWVSQSIIGWESTVGAWTRLEGVTVLGQDVTVKDELHLNGARVLPHKTIKESVSHPSIIM